MGNKIFTGFLIIVLSVSFWLLPVDHWIYTWQTNVRTDSFDIYTGPGVTTKSVTLHEKIFDDDTTTVELISYCSTDALTFTSYNTTTRVMALAGLTANITRGIDISYDAPAFSESTVYDFFASFALWFTYIMFIIFPLAGLVYVFRDSIRSWLS